MEEQTQVVQESETPSQDSAAPAEETPAVDSGGSETPVQEEPQLSLAEKIAKKAAEVAAKDPAAAAGQAPKAAPEAQAAGKPAIPGAPIIDPTTAYKPDFKYKFAVEGGEKQEAEFPEFLRGAVKTKEQEDELRTLCAKAKGLDFVKPRFEHLRNEYKNVNNAHSVVMKSIEELRANYQRGDFDSFFARLQIPQEKVLQWVLEKVNYSELPPDQRAVYDSRRDAERRAYQAEQMLGETEGRALEQMQNAKALSLDAGLTRPDISAIAAGYEARTQKPGSFRELVRSHGELTWFRSNGKVDLTPDQAIQEVVALYGLTPAPAAAAVPATPGLPAQTAPAAPAAQQAAIPTIPNVTGRANSPIPVKPKPKNLAELRKLGKEAAQA